MRTYIERNKLRTPFELALAAAASAATGVVLAAADASIAAVGALIIGIGTVLTFLVSIEFLLMLILGTSPIGLEQLTTGRNFFTSLGGFDVASLRIGILIVVGGTLLGTRGLPRKIVWQEKAYLILIGWLLVTLTFSPNIFGGLRYTAKVAVLLITWISFSWVIRKYGKTLVINILLLTLALQLLCDYALLGAGLGYLNVGGAVRFGGLAAAPASAAMSVAVLGLVALYVWFDQRRYYALALYLLSWGPVVFSITRIAIGGFLIASVSLAVLMGRRRQAFTILFLIIVVTFSYAPLRERMAFGSASQSWQSVFSTVQSHGVSGINTEGRLKLWAPLMEQFKQDPVLGNGVGDSEVISSAITHEYIVQAHSDYLAMLVNGGLIAGLLWLISLGGLAVRFMRTRGLTSLAAAGIILYFTTAITDNAVEMYAELGIPLAMIIALAFSQDTQVHDKSAV
jgi:O-antigen ligase